MANGKKTYKICLFLKFLIIQTIYAYIENWQVVLMQKYEYDILIVVKNYFVA